MSTKTRATIEDLYRLPDGAKAEGVPVFTVEVRSENDHGQIGERAIAQKIADYFAAGALVFWDVDLCSSDVIKSYSADKPDKPKIFRRGDVSDAEPAVPDWRIRVDDLFPLI